MYVQFSPITYSLASFVRAMEHASDHHEIESPNKHIQIDFFLHNGVMALRLTHAPSGRGAYVVFDAEKGIPIYVVAGNDAAFCAGDYKSALALGMQPGVRGYVPNTLFVVRAFDAWLTRHVLNGDATPFALV